MFMRFPGYTSTTHKSIKAKDEKYKQQRTFNPLKPDKSGMCVLTWGRLQDKGASSVFHGDKV